MAINEKRREIAFFYISYHNVNIIFKYFEVAFMKILEEKFKAKLLKFISNEKSGELIVLKKILEDDKNRTGDYPSSPGMANLNKIKSTGEKAFQRAIFNKKKTILNYKGLGRTDIITWFDLELPITFNKNSRRRCLDLIGFSDDTPIICELKYYETTPSNQPIYAVVELLVYYYFILCNYKKLDKYNIHHHLADNDFKWKTIAEKPKPKLLVAANSVYWNRWFKKIDKNTLTKQVAKLGKELNIEIYLFEAVNEDFILQKNSRPTFNPAITSNIWREI